MEFIKRASEEVYKYMSEKYSDWLINVDEIEIDYKEEYDQIYEYFYRIITFSEGDIITGFCYGF